MSSIGIDSRERFLLKEHQFLSTLVMHQVKSENIGEDYLFVNAGGEIPMENKVSMCKLENEDSNFSNFNESFSLKIDSFSSHMVDESRHENSTIKSENLCDISIKNGVNSQYLNNYGEVVNISRFDHFDFCLKGIHRTEFELNSHLLQFSDVSSDSCSRIVRTSQRFKNLGILEIRENIHHEILPDSTAKFINKDKVESKHSKTTEKRNEHKKQKRQFICEICSAKYFYELSYLNHISKHTIKFECKFCTHSYPSQRSLSSHMRVHKNIPSSKRTKYTNKL